MTWDQLKGGGLQEKQKTRERERVEIQLGKQQNQNYNGPSNARVQEIQI